MTKFRDLAIGDTFDFIGPDRYNSFFARCTKLTARKYKYENGHPKPFHFYVATVGTINVEVFNVQKAETV